MTTVLVAIAVFVVVALAGWAIAEGKYKACAYIESAEEQEALEKFNELHLKDGGREMNIGDVMNTISTKGFSAV